jgi:hypothetical protein
VVVVVMTVGINLKLHRTRLYQHATAASRCGSLLVKVAPVVREVPGMSVVAAVISSVAVAPSGGFIHMLTRRSRTSSTTPPTTQLIAPTRKFPLFPWPSIRCPPTPTTAALFSGPFRSFDDNLELLARVHSSTGKDEANVPIEIYLPPLPRAYWRAAKVEVCRIPQAFASSSLGRRRRRGRIALLSEKCLCTRWHGLEIVGDEKDLEGGRGR